MANTKNEGSKPAAGRWEKPKSAGSPPMTTPGSERAFDARPKPSNTRNPQQDYQKRQAHPAPPEDFDSPEET